MQYVEFRDAVQGYLRKRPSGSTWKQLRADLRLPYEIPCPAWVRRMETEIGLHRAKGPRGKIWTLTRGRGR